jgi:hypothetical protein
VSLYHQQEIRAYGSSTNAYNDGPLCLATRIPDGGGPAISTEVQTEAGITWHTSGITNAIFITSGMSSSPYTYTFSSTFNGPIFVPNDPTVLG